jgi:hypothetical protein
MENSRIQLARQVFDYLYLKDEQITPCDVVIGFGHFDLGIPRYCVDLYIRGFAKWIIFTGGVGTGSADFKYAEGIEFLNEAKKLVPGIEKYIIVESKSTHTGENVQFTKEVLERDIPELAFDKGIKSAILVSSAYRQRRVYLSCLKQLPGVNGINAPVKTTFEREISIFESKGQDLISFLPGEIDRLVNYAEKGFIEKEEVPAEILKAAAALKA